jgi:hypothetical protein
MRRRIFCACAALLLAACGSPENRAPADAGTDAGVDAGPTGDGVPDLDDGGCYAHPSPASNFEIINACTDAGYVDKHPSYPHNLTDGGLGPLP